MPDRLDFSEFEERLRALPVGGKIRVRHADLIDGKAPWTPLLHDRAREAGITITYKKVYQRGGPDGYRVWRTG